MATGTISWPAEALQAPDDTASNKIPGLIAYQGTQSPKAITVARAFDPTTNELLQTPVFELPRDYASGGTLRIYTQVNATTSANYIFGAQVSAITPSDADTPTEHAWSTAATVTIANITAEARRLNSGTITLNMDSAAIGDMMKILIYRDAASASDTLTAADVELRLIAFEYITL